MALMLILSFVIYAPGNSFASSSQFTTLAQFEGAVDAELEAQGIKVLGGESKILQPAKSGNLKAKPSTVYVTWRIGYTATLGLSFYTRAYSTDLNCLLKSMAGANEYQDLGSAAKGYYEIRVTNIVPTYAINHTTETNKKFASGTVLECQAYVDIDAINEISGGEWYGSDVVTIP